MPRYIRLSYDISNKTPLYPGISPVSIKQEKGQRRGDSCNTYRISFSNHAGTHIDGPKHFFHTSRAIADYPIDAFVFERPHIIDCRKEAAGVIGKIDLERAIRLNNFDILIIKTGFSRYRESDKMRYAYRNPYLSPDAAEFLRNEYRNMKALGIDCISIASRVNREAGRKVHSILLGKGKRPGPVFIIEDMRIPGNVRKLDRVIAVPMLFKGIDSAPCNIIGIING